MICYVTDRQLIDSSRDSSLAETLLEKITEAAKAGVDWIQVREKDLSAAELSELVREAKHLAPSSCRILVNDRLDVAYVAGADGVHLGEKSISVQDARRFARERHLVNDFLIGVSVHSLEAAKSAQAGGADYVIFGPVFATPSKASFGPPQGLQRLAELCGGVSLPVVAIGGITLENAAACYDCGASGIAAIRIFQDARDLGAIVGRLRG